jgi:hypothetical protein
LGAPIFVPSTIKPIVKLIAQKGSTKKKKEIVLILEYRSSNYMAHVVSTQSAAGSHTLNYVHLFVEQRRRQTNSRLEAENFGSSSKHADTFPIKNSS